jgi:hypothetical protein
LILFLATDGKEQKPVTGDWHLGAGCGSFLPGRG